MLASLGWQEIKVSCVSGIIKWLIFIEKNVNEGKFYLENFPIPLYLPEVLFVLPLQGHTTFIISTYVF